MKKIKSIIIGLAIVFLMVSAVYAQIQCEHKQRGEGQRGGVFKELKLTPEQQKKLEENRKAQREEITKLRMAIKEKQQKLQEELKNPVVTKAAVEPIVNEIKSLQAQLIDHRISGIFAVKEILTPEQFAKFQQMTGRWQENRKEYFQNWRERRRFIH